jgi:selenide,water dikinase
MLCGGCAAKLGQERLERVLARLEPPPADASVELGLDSADDAAAWQVGGGRRAVASIDAFRGFTDDPYLVGRVGAVNALSDLWAKGVRPRWALALVALPETAPGEADEEELYQVLAGARSVLDAAGVTLVGGHTTTAADLMVGFTVEGLAEEAEPLRRLDGLRPDRSLVLSKPLGTGVLFHADMEGALRGPWFVAALAAMQRTNAAAAEVAAAYGAGGVTDVTGFGLAGHLGAMTRASGLSATVVLESLPVLPGTLELLDRGLRSTFHGENSRLRRGLLIDPEASSDPRLELLFDPQTAGGLLFDVDPESAKAAVEQLRQAGDKDAAIIGETSAAEGTPGALSIRHRW